MQVQVVYILLLFLAVILVGLLAYLGWTGYLLSRELKELAASYQDLIIEAEKIHKLISRNAHSRENKAYQAQSKADEAILSYLQQKRH